MKTFSAEAMEQLLAKYNRYIFGTSSATKVLSFGEMEIVPPNGDVPCLASSFVHTNFVYCCTRI